MNCPFLELRLWPLLAAMTASFILGLLWYSPRVLGTAWLRLRDRRIEEIRQEELRRPLRLSPLVPALLSVPSLALLLAWMRIQSMSQALVLASLLSLGFGGGALLMPKFAEGRSLPLYLIYWAYFFCALNLSAFLLILL